MSVGWDKLLPREKTQAKAKSHFAADIAFSQWGAKFHAISFWRWRLVVLSWVEVGPVKQFAVFGGQSWHYRYVQAAIMHMLAKKKTRQTGGAQYQAFWLQ